MVAPGICHVKGRLVDLIGSSGIENATSAQPKNLASAPPFGFLGEWLGTRLGRCSYFGSGVAKFTRSEERGCGFVLSKFQQARTARVCTLALLLNDLEIDSSLLPSLIPSLK